jgi:hypothetical protein
MVAASPAARLHSARGAILIQVAASLLSLTMISAFVIDFGMVLVSRAEAQTVADAAALAGATALGFDRSAAFTDSVELTARAKAAAVAVATANTVWNAAPIETAIDVTPWYCPNIIDPPPTYTLEQTCVKVDVFRNVARGNPLPSYFGKLLGVASQSVEATAIAQARAGNATDCIKPLAVPDRWTEITAGPDWLPESTFDKWNPANPIALLDPRDSYTAPGFDFIGTGLTLSDNLGDAATLTPGTTAIPVTTIKPWRYVAVQIPDSVHGNDLRANINSCAEAAVAIGDILPLEPGYVPATATAGIQDLINQDPGAVWNAAAGRVDNSCADRPPRCASFSPRIIALPVYDVNHLADNSRTVGIGATSVQVRNIIGFFIESIAGDDMSGRIVQHPGLMQGTAITLPDESTFLRATLLVK